MTTISKLKERVHIASLTEFLAQNPFTYPNTLGFFYREKMRAIHRIAPNLVLDKILEIGGGQGGLTALLYPQAQITNLDCNPDFANASCNQLPNVNFVCGDATELPFDDCSFTVITMFDVLEHIADDRLAIKEALRVLKPGGFLLLSTPNENWRFPYYDWLRPVCPTEQDVMTEWGHVRRGYTKAELEELIALPCHKYATFINPLTVLCHDLAFSNLSTRRKRWLCNLMSPITWISYFLHRPYTQGTETAYMWQKMTNGTDNYESFE